MARRIELDVIPGPAVAAPEVEEVPLKKAPRADATAFGAFDLRELIEPPKVGASPHFVVPADDPAETRQWSLAPDRRAS